MKYTITLLSILLSLPSCKKQLVHNCICRLTVTENGVTSSAGSLTEELHDFRETAEQECKTKEPENTYTVNYQPYPQHYSATCYLE